MHQHFFLQRLTSDAIYHQTRNLCHRPFEESIVTVFQNVQVKLLQNIHVYTNRFVMFPTLIRDASDRGRCWLTERHSTVQGLRKTELCELSHIRDFVSSATLRHLHTLPPTKQREQHVGDRRQEEHCEMLPSEWHGYYTQDSEAVVIEKRPSLSKQGNNSSM